MSGSWWQQEDCRAPPKARSNVCATRWCPMLSRRRLCGLATYWLSDPALRLLDRTRVTRPAEFAARRKGIAAMLVVHRRAPQFDAVLMGPFDVVVLGEAAIHP